MREELRPLLDKPVHIRGTVADHRQHGNSKLYDVLLTAVEVRPVDNSRPLLSIEPIVIDHLWRIEPARVYPIGTVLSGLGKPGFYARRNGSIDIGVHPTLSLDATRLVNDLAARVEQLHPTRRVGVVAGVLAEMETAAATHQLFLDCDRESVDAFLATWRSALAQARRDLAAERRGHASSWAARLAHQHGQHITRRERREADRQARRTHPTTPTLTLAI